MFYRVHLRKLVSYLVYQGAAAHVAAELAHDTMIEVYQRWDAIKTPRAYAWTVAGRAYIRHAVHEESPVAEVPEPSAVLPDPQGIDAWLKRQQIVDTLRALPPRQRQVLALWYDGWTPAEIAELIGINAAAVRSNLRKARRVAAEYLRRDEGHGGEEP